MRWRKLELKKRGKFTNESVKKIDLSIKIQ